MGSVRILIFFATYVSVFGLFTLYSVQMRENTDEKNSEYEHFSRSVRRTQLNTVS